MEIFAPLEPRKTNPIQTQTNPIAKRPTMSVNKVLTEDYENLPLRGLPNTNPIKPNTNPIEPNGETASEVHAGFPSCENHRPSASSQNAIGSAGYVQYLLA